MKTILRAAMETMRTIRDLTGPIGPSTFPHVPHREPSIR